MKTLEELKARFASIQDLPVSEEMIGAYLEGNLNGSELRDVQNVITEDQSVYDLIDAVESPMSFGDNYMEYEHFNDNMFDESIMIIDEINVPFNLLDEYYGIIELGNCDVLNDGTSIINVGLHDLNMGDDSSCDIEHQDDSCLDINTLY